MQLTGTDGYVSGSKKSGRIAIRELCEALHAVVLL